MAKKGNIINKHKKFLMRLLSHHFLPRHVIIEPSPKCNLKCITCINSKLPNEANSYMSYDLFKSIIDQMRGSLPTAKAITLTGMGEPFLNPNLVSIVKYAKRSGLEVTLNSNLTIATEKDLLELIEAKLDKLSISMDGATKKTFELIRVKAIFENVLKRVIFTLRARQRLGVKRPKIYFNCVIIKENIHEAAKIIRLAEKLGVDGVYFNKPTYPRVKFSEISTYGLQVKELSSAKVKVDVTYLSDVVPHCRAPRSCYVTFDGRVLPCTIVAMTVPRSEYSLYELGNLTKQSLKEVWFSPRYRELRSRMIYFGSGCMPFCEWCPHANT